MPSRIIGGDPDSRTVDFSRNPLQVFLERSYEINKPEIDVEQGPLPISIT